MITKMTTRAATERAIAMVIFSSRLPLLAAGCVLAIGSEGGATSNLNPIPLVEVLETDDITFARYGFGRIFVGRKPSQKEDNCDCILVALMQTPISVKGLPSARPLKLIGGTLIQRFTGNESTWKTMGAGVRGLFEDVGISVQK